MPLSVTISGRRQPCAVRYGAASRRARGPKRISVGKAKRWIAITRGSDNLEIAFQFPVGDCVLELAPFPFARLDIMIDKRFAEQFAGELRLLEVRGGFHEVARQARNAGRFCAVAFERRGRELEAFFDAV